MSTSEVTGIIDIGSNTVRLTVYKINDKGAYKAIDQGRWPARLSQRLSATGNLSQDAIMELSQVLLNFIRICEKHRAATIRAVATAAIRQSVNRDDIVKYLFDTTGIQVEILSGADEARIGSIAMLGSLPISDGYVVDIGGGSTEVSLLHNRRLSSVISLPIGSVNTSVRFAAGENPVSPSVLSNIQSEIRRLLSKQKWIRMNPDLPLIGLGGTVRALAKVHKSQSGYPFPLLHGYQLSESQISDTLEQLARIPAEKRRKLSGISKDRADVIVPGLALLLGVFRQTSASQLTVCGAGLRDGLFYETCLPHLRWDSEDQVLEESLRNLKALYQTAPEDHLRQVSKLSLVLFDRLVALHQLPAFSRQMLDAAAQLYRIGGVIDFNNIADHTFYILLHNNLKGLSHRHMLITAGIASFRGTNQLRQKLKPYRSLLLDGDYELITKLGALLQLSSALDRSESQAITKMDVAVAGRRLEMTVEAQHPLPLEQMEVKALMKDFKKIWGLDPILKLEI
ncbi:Ppx/GppA family phosphatase [Cohnella pontilimi]|uniref:Chaperone protein DnaK n=1 Tax=Cohnella pontilimi TaxID=2564100 RepID=A0A4U0FGL6_9BACL|nr:Ppx/GppA phosphatase family protein [Cohnella pontilimi]TJY44146.1 Ppx/GppA family phosphatase [Cohnella pontilimi]